MATVNVERFCLAEPVSSQKGVKTAQLTIDNQAVYWWPDALEVAFEPRGYEGTDSSRVSLCLFPLAAEVKQMMEIDEAIVDLATAQSASLFGKPLTRDMVRMCYTPLFYQKGAYPALLRAKLVTSGRSQTKYWDDKTKAPLEFPKEWKGRKVLTKILLKGLWFQGNSFGLTAEFADILIGDRVVNEDVCPWNAQFSPNKKCEVGASTKYPEF